MPTSGPKNGEKQLVRKKKVNQTGLAHRELKRAFPEDIDADASWEKNQSIYTHENKLSYLPHKPEPEKLRA